MAQPALSIMPVYGNNPPVNPIQAAATPAPTAPAAPPPNFNDIQKNLNTPIQINGQQPIGGSATFERGVTASTPSTGISPQTQAILDIIKKNQDYATNVGVANASSLAAKRGITGSSTEMFGANEAVGQASRAAQDANATALNNDFQAQQQMAQLQAKGIFDRANTESTVGAQLGINIANLSEDQRTKLASLTSDEIASLRNMDFQNRSLALQQLLGQQAIQQGQANINASKDIAKQGAQYGLLGAGIGATVPSLLAHAFPVAGAAAVPGTASTVANIAAATGAGANGIPLASAVNTGPTSIGAGGGAAIVGAGAGAMALSKATENAVAAKNGATAGTVAGVVANPIGYQLNVAKDIVSNPKQALATIGKNVSSAVSKAFSGGKTGDGAAIAAQSTMLQNNLDQVRQLKAARDAGQLTEAQYQAQAAPILSFVGARVQGLTGRDSNWASAINPTWQQFQKEGFVTAQNGKWVMGTDPNNVLWDNATNKWA